MPQYVYECINCGKLRTEFVSIKEAGDKVFNCGCCGSMCKKLITPASVIYKGSGFYTTDYKNKNK